MMLFTFAQISCALIVLAEALNKLHRCDLHLMRPREWKASNALQVLAWSFIAVGAFAVLLAAARPTLQACLLVAGMATLIVRSRLKELTP